MKVNTLNPANVLCPSLLTTRYDPSCLWPGGGIRIQGSLVPEVTVGEGLEIVEILATLRWKNSAGVTLNSSTGSVYFGQVENEVRFNQYFQGLSQYSEVCTLHVELLITMRNPQQQLVYSSNGYSTGLQWPKPQIPASIGCQFINQDGAENNAFVSATEVASAAWYEFQTCDLNNNPVGAVQQVYAGEDPGTTRQQWIARPYTNAYKVRARVGNLMGWSGWGYSSEIPATIVGSASPSIDEVPSKSFHHLTVNYNIEGPTGSQANIVLKRNGTQIENPTIAAQNGSYTFSNLPDTSGGWNYIIQLRGKTPTGSWKTLAEVSISGGYSGNE